MALSPLLLVSLFGALAMGAAADAVATNLNGGQPTVKLQNGSYYGVFNPTYDQDFFLGMPYAEPPVGDLRFRRPQPLNSTWDEPRNATVYQPSCYNYPYPVGPLIGGTDDCLTINVVRPAGLGIEAKLPVAIWIHGGGLVSGTASAFNMSSIVDESIKMGAPVIVASINYRLHAWGFLWGQEMEAEGAGNNGFRDQNLALQWVQENIQAFGGDPDKVTIWGQSGGARSVASHLTAFGGRDDGLFRAAILQSGTGFFTDFGEVKNAAGPTWESAYASLLNRTDCESADNTLQCLREIPADDLAVTLGNVSFPPFLDIIDGDFIEAPRSELIRQGKFIPVPIINGVATDDGDYFSQHGINTTDEWNAYLRSQGAANDTIEVISALYPDIPRLGLPATYKGRPIGKDAEYGSQWKRAMAFGGDRAMQAPRRAWVRTWAAANATAYSYRFDVATPDRPAVQGAGHSVELPFLFYDARDSGGDSDEEKSIFADGQPNAEEYRRLAGTMSRMWVSFFNHMNPNMCSDCQEWPAYALEEAENLVFDADEEKSSYLEADTWRSEQLEYLNQKLWKTGIEAHSLE